MTPSEAGQVLMVAAAYDNRTIGETNIIAWAQAMPDISLEEGKTAVIAHYRDEVKPIMPAHIRAIVRKARNQAIEQRQQAALLASIRDRQTTASQPEQVCSECGLPKTRHHLSILAKNYPDHPWTPGQPGSHTNPSLKPATRAGRAGRPTSTHGQPLTGPSRQDLEAERHRQITALNKLITQEELAA
ncbi:MAG: hypothetical protein LBV30_05110 [Propionibacteriaceae bacterium]|jgi:hypothetical protein|nr:hypothetical protein [Propionibacteriaceae bacterium]